MNSASNDPDTVEVTRFLVNRRNASGPQSIRVQNVLTGFLPSHATKRCLLVKDLGRSLRREYERLTWNLFQSSDRAKTLRLLGRKEVTCLDS